MNPPPDPTTEQTRAVRETVDNPVVRFRDLESKLDPLEADLRLGKWAIGILAAFTASPKLGGPSASQVIGAAIGLIV